ncbi:hypothetical protein GCM10011349_26530 [Novosphingobium indicum]|uniref:Uncharacterized protein n=1 Tax=Novosphingobium indicum TaxID=462949 RepID=A0ABQ2JT76_9SPHN|nr:hypothetical protein GCM10011349_26530 [Novosphingobium indicum]
MSILTFEIGDKIGEPQPIDTGHQNRPTSIIALDFEGKSMKHVTGFYVPHNVRKGACAATKQNGSKVGASGTAAIALNCANVAARKRP